MEAKPDEDYLFGHFKSLNEQMHRVQPIFEEFCCRNGFERFPRRSLGRYPRERIQRPGNPWLWYDLTMGCDESGRRYEDFSPEIPYEMSCGATYEESSCRYTKAITCFRDLTFGKVTERLERELNYYLPTLKSWDADILKREGRCVKL